MKKSQYVNDTKLVAFCGLYCGTCTKYLKGKCPGCAKNHKANWCKIRTCNIDSYLSSCAHCTMLDPSECKKLNNTIGRIFMFLFKTDRLTSLRYICNKGEKAYTDKMCQLGQMAIKKNQKLS